ncbi:MAG: DUF2079 domain-containing protein [Myxococcota bacterium]
MVRVWGLAGAGAYIAGVVLLVVFNRGRVEPLPATLREQTVLIWILAFGYLGISWATWGRMAGLAVRGSPSPKATKGLLGFGVAGLVGLVAFIVSPHAIHLLMPLAALTLSVPVGIAGAKALPFSDRILGHRSAPWIFGTACSAYFFALTYVRHVQFGSGSRDMGLFTQSVWLLSRGYSPNNTILGMNAFGDHMEWIDLLVAPLMWLWNDGGTLLLVQAVCVGMGAVPVFRLASHHLGSPTAGVLAAVAYFGAYDIVSAIEFDWNPTTLSIGFFPWAAEAALSRRYRTMGCFLVLIALCKENLVLYVAAFGVVLFLWRAPWRVAATVLLAALAFFVVEMKIVFPLFRPDGFRHFYYREIGDGFSDLLGFAIQSPGAAFALLFTPPERKLDGLLIPFTSTGFLGLLSPTTLITVLPGLCERFWSSFPNAWWGHHYGGPTHAMAVTAGVLGAAKVKAMLNVWLPNSSVWSRFARIWPMLFMSTAGVLVDVTGPWPRLDLFEFDKPYLPSEPDRRAMRHALAVVPDDAAVAAQNHLVPHLATRREIYLLEDAHRADVVVVSLDTSPWPYTRGYHERLVRRLHRSGWATPFCTGRTIVLSRTATTSVACAALAPAGDRSTR